MLKTFVVGILSLFDYDLKLLKISAENEYEALKKGMIESCSEKYKQDEELRGSKYKLRKEEEEYTTNNINK